jgi:hypothetical protein
MCERVRCHGGETSCFYSTCLDVCAECPPSAASQPHSKTFHWRFDQGVGIPCGQCLGCRKKINMDLILLRTWRSFFGHGEFGDFHCDDCCSVSGSLSYTHVSSPVMILEMKLESSLACCLISPQTETRRVFWSSLSSLGTNLEEMRLMFKLSAKIRWTVPHESPTILHTSWIVCLRSARIASRTFAMFSGVVLVDGRPERSSSSTDVRPSLKRLYYKKFCFGSWHLSPKASCSIRWVSVAVFFKIETIFNADSLLLKIGHINCKKNSPDP